MISPLTHFWEGSSSNIIFLLSNPTLVDCFEEPWKVLFLKSFISFSYSIFDFSKSWIFFFKLFVISDSFWDCEVFNSSICFLSILTCETSCLNLFISWTWFLTADNSATFALKELSSINCFLREAISSICFLIGLNWANWSFIVWTSVVWNFKLLNSDRLLCFSISPILLFNLLCNSCVSFFKLFVSPSSLLIISSWLCINLLLKVCALNCLVCCCLIFLLFAALTVVLWIGRVWFPWIWVLYWAVSVGVGSDSLTGVIVGTFSLLVAAFL